MEAPLKSNGERDILGRGPTMPNEAGAQPTVATGNASLLFGVLVGSG
jgi:hypothetical protein